MKLTMVAIASLVTVLAACSSQPPQPAASSPAPAVARPAVAAVGAPGDAAAAAAAPGAAAAPSAAARTASPPATVTSSPAAATRSPSAATSSPPAAANTTGTATADPPINRTLVSAGYKPRTIKGAVYYCRTVDVTNTAFKKKVCLNESQIQDEERRIKEMQREMLRRQPNASCLGPTCAGN